MMQQNLPKIKFKMSKEEITSHSGLVVVREILRRIVKREWLRKFLPYRGSNRGYWAEEFVEPMILMLCGGGNRTD